MVSTCHVNLLFSPAAFHMQYTPKSCVSLPLLLSSYLLLISLTLRVHGIVDGFKIGSVFLPH